MTLAHRLAKNGGVAACGNHLGVMVASSDLACKCPAGWAFIDLAAATPAIVQEVMDACKAGRQTWPEKIDGTKPVATKRVS